MHYMSTLPEKGRTNIMEILRVKCPQSMFQHLQASQRSPGHLMAQGAREDPVIVVSWHLSFLIVSHSRAADQALRPLLETSYGSVETASPRGGEEGAVTMDHHYLPHIIRPSCNLIPSQWRSTAPRGKQGWGGVGPEQCKGLWGCIFSPPQTCSVTS